MRTDRQAVPDIYSWHCLKCLDVKADVIACRQVVCVCVCVSVKETDREDWCFSFPGQET